MKNIERISAGPNEAAPEPETTGIIFPLAHYGIGSVFVR